MREKWVWDVACVYGACVLRGGGALNTCSERRAPVWHLLLFVACHSTCVSVEPRYGTYFSLYPVTPPV